MSWQAKCQECGWEQPPDRDKQYVEGMATLHKVKTGHDVLTCGSNGIPSEGVVAVGKMI